MLGVRMYEPVVRILIVDDEEPIRSLLATFLAGFGYETATAPDAHEALLALRKHEFDLVLSDVRMPGMSGIELLSHIKSGDFPAGVVLLTGCDDVGMAVSAMKLGALDYILKPFQLEDVGSSIRKALDARREVRRKEDRLEHLEQTVQRQTVELRRTLEHLQEASEITLDALVAALDAREHETQAHSKRVSEYTIYLARALGVDPALLDVIRRGAMLHDIGKIGIPDTILFKPSALSDLEWREMRRHPQIGFWILNGITSLSSASDVVLAHHERFDGQGYPRGLKGEEIPLGARIFSVADSLDAITSDRPYQRGKTYDQARLEIERNSGTQFDPQVVRQFLKIPANAWFDIRERTLAAPARRLPDIAPLVLR